MQSVFILDGSSQEAIGVLNPELPDGCPFMNDIRTERLEHGFLTLEFDVPANHPTAQLLINENFIVYPNLDGKYELYRIKDTKGQTADGQYMKSVFCENSAVTDLLASVVRPASFPSTNLRTVMTTILSGTQWTAGSVPSNDNKDFAFTDYISSLEALHTALSFFDAEISFLVEFDGLKITKRYVDVGKRGTTSLKPFVYGIDLVSVEREENTDDLVTALIGVGKTLDNGSTVTLANYTPPGLDTNKYIKDFAADWIGNKDAFTQFALNGNHRSGVHKDENAETQFDLYMSTLAKLDELSTPKLTYTVNVLLLEKLLGETHKVRLGDTIVVQDTTYEPDILLEARVIETKTSIIDPDANKVTLGDYVEILETSSNRINSLLEQLAQNAEQWNKAVKTANDSLGTGAHVIASGEKFDATKGGYYADGTSYSLKITVTDNVHLDSCTVYCENSNTNGTVWLLDDNDNIITSKNFTNLGAGANVIKLGFLLTPYDYGGKYRLSGVWDDTVFRKTQELDVNSYPYISGAFSITGTTSSFGYWYWFFDLRIGGANVDGGYGGSLLVGNTNDQLGIIQSFGTDGEAVLVVDSGQVSIGTANIGQINSESVVSYSADDITYYVNATTGNDENDGLTSGTALASVMRAISLIPRSIDGQVVINVLSDTREDISIKGFTGFGSITLYFGTRTGAARPYTYSHYVNYGQLRIDSCTIEITFTYGKYFPASDTVTTGNDSATLQVYRSPYVLFWQNYISGKIPQTSTYTTNAVVAYESSHVLLSSCHIQDWGTGSAARASNHSSVMFNSCTGNSTSATGTAMTATFNGMVGVNSSISDLLNIDTSTNGGFPRPPSSPTIYVATAGGIIQGGNGLSGLTGTIGTSTTQPSASPTTVIYSSTDGRSYRYTKYIGWRSEQQVMEGDYGYGNHKGLWFFNVGTTPPWVGKTIKEIWVYAIRLERGGGAGTVRFKTHNYTTKPAGEPTIGTSYVSGYFAYGDKKWIRLDGNSTIKTAFANNTAKGICIDGGAYAIFDWHAKLKVVYQ